MIRNYIKIAWRNLFRNKLYSFINIIGLAMGISAFLLLLEYLSFEKSVNSFHKNLPDIYRLINEDVKGETWPQVEPGWAQKAKEAFPEIKDFCRFEEGIAQGIVSRPGDNNRSFRETGIGYAEGNFFEFFSFNILSGKPSGLKKPNTVFISKSTAAKYFGQENPIGKTLVLHNQFGNTTFNVEGIYTIPVNSDIHFDMVFSLETLNNPAALNGNGWASLENLDSQYIYTYFLLNTNTNHLALEQKLTTLRNKLSKENDGLRFRLQPLANLHLPASFSENYQTYGNLKYIYILSIISLLILAIAWFNYINLSTANSVKRANEVGIRKVIGASKSSLMLQFTGESLLINLLGFGVAVLFIYLAQPLFNQISGKDLSLQALGYSSAWITGLALLLTGSLLSGAYTAYALSKYNPVDTIKGRLTAAKGALLRKTLVVTQFAVSITLILSTFLIYKQLKYMQNSNLGLNTEQLLVVRGPEIGRDSTYKNRSTAFWNAVAQQSFVKDYAVSGSVPGSYYNFSTSGFTQPGSKSGDELKSYSFAIIGEGYLPAYQIGLKAGRNFTAAETSVEWNDNSKVLMNERAIKELGFSSAEEALHTAVQWDERPLEIIGVVKDYHHTGLQKAIDPIIFYPQNSGNYFTVRLNTGNLQNEISRLETLYKQFFAGNPFDYFFADENFNKQYTTELQYGQLFTTASVWAIIIACLGLFGLTTFTVTSRTKEIGIRKVLGASVSQITTLLSKDFLRLVLIAILIASPIAWFAVHQWLQDFAYRTNINWWVFVLVGLLAIVIAFVTISFQAVKAARANPVKSLRTE